MGTANAMAGTEQSATSASSRRMLFARRLVEQAKVPLRDTVHVVADTCKPLVGRLREVLDRVRPVSERVDVKTDVQMRVKHRQGLRPSGRQHVTRRARAAKQVVNLPHRRPRIATNREKRSPRACGRFGPRDAEEVPYGVLDV